MADAINQKVVQWASGKVGQMVGSGECWDLANGALTDSGANSSTTTGADDDYVWGDAVDLSQVIPGDILQFRDYTVTTTTTTTATFDDKSETEDTQTASIDRPHHTAIVWHTTAPGALDILEQNAPPAGRRVQRFALITRGSTSTTTERKTVKDAKNKLRLATVVRTVEIQVSGRIQAYRPKAK